VLGVGSFTYVMLTRDSAGFAAKGSWFEVFNEKEQFKSGYNIYKDPITDDGQKRSLKGLLMVSSTFADKTNDDKSVEYFVKQECTKEEENEGLLQVIYVDGTFQNQTSLTEIRTKIK
jgi:nicotinamide phosphoribosyltransferase